MSLAPTGAKKKATPTLELPPQADDGAFYIQLPLDRAVPNDWNMNVMPAMKLEKLRAGMKDLLKRGKKLIPIAVRNHPTRPGFKQIIDGEHRWKELREWGPEEFGRTWIEAVDYGDLDDAKTMELTPVLNYNRGEPDPDRYVLYLKRYLETSRYTLEQAAVFLPDSVDEMQHALASYEIKIDHLEAPSDGDDADSEDKRGVGEQSFIEVKFLLPREAAEVVESALARVGAILKGKNIRGRSLELIAADSLNTPLESYGVKEEQPQKVDTNTPIGRTKSKLKDVADGN